MTLTTKSEYDRSSPRVQGYTVYMQADWPGSELKGLSNPYEEGSWEHEEWNRGEFMAILDAQDGDD